MTPSGGGAMVRGRQAGWILAILCLIGYSGAARLLGERYPFSPLTMFSDRIDASSRIAVRTGVGHVRELRDYVEWHCAAPVDITTPPRDRACAVTHAENDQLAVDWILAHRAALPTGEPVEVVRRVFRVDSEGVLSVRDCPLASCHARPR